MALNDIVEEVATTRVQVTVDGRVRTMPALKAILMLEVRKALQGDGKASRFVLETFESRGLGGAVKGRQDDFATHIAGARERLAKVVERALANVEPITPDPSLPPGQPGSQYRWQGRESGWCNRLLAHHGYGAFRVAITAIST
ncbi:hypothetical protein ATE48_12815 [Candidatus Viadribacter manganicus]|uniref:Uncharacterized protein n=1 Tax=Candidatus Viadribacter manganicus TaxID=1759059 RepID=A0A1B1AJK3_9PROT|nr:hypothetical protein ATE48_12815 [Candidatus Viadribacter manganicus]